MARLHAEGTSSREIAEAVFAAEDDLLAVGCREVKLPFARALIDERHPSIYDVNCLRGVHGNPSMEEIELGLARVIGGSGCRHRRIASRDPATIRRLDELLLPRAFTRQTCVAMYHVGDVPAALVPRGLSLVLVDEDDAQLMRAVTYCQDLVRRDEPWYAPEVSRQMDELSLRQVRDGGAELLAAQSAQGEVLSSLLLRCAGGVGFIADVGTPASYRERGIATALVAAATALARERGCGVIGLTARRDDRPRRIYEKLGFVVAGESIDYLRGV